MYCSTIQNGSLADGLSLPKKKVKLIITAGGVVFEPISIFDCSSSQVNRRNRIRCEERTASRGSESDGSCVTKTKTGSYAEPPIEIGNGFSKAQVPFGVHRKGIKACG